MLEREADGGLKKQGTGKQPSARVYVGSVSSGVTSTFCLRHHVIPCFASEPQQQSVMNASKLEATEMYFQRFLSIYLSI